MKIFFLLTFVGLLLLSGIAYVLQPGAIEGGKVPLIWVADDAPARREQVALFNRLNPEYKLTLDPANVQMEKVIVQSLAGVGPDLFSTFDGFALSSFIKAGIAWDITDLLKTAGIEYKEDVWPAAYPTFMFDDRAYGFPANVAVDAIWFHKDLFEQSGAAPPAGPLKWEEFIPLAQKLTLRDERGRVRRYGFLFDFAGAWPQFMLQWGARLYNEDGSRCTINSPQAIAATQFMHDLIYKHKVAPTPLDEAAMATQGGWGSGTITWFGGKRGAMALGGRWWLISLRNYENLNLGAFEAPHHSRRVFRGYGKGIIINAKSPRREEALKFIAYLYGREYNELINSQADGLAPVKKYAYSEKFLHDPEYPNEDFNEVWRDIMNFAVPDQVSPYISGQVANRIILGQLELVKSNLKPPAQALETMEREINKEIQKNIKLDPELRERLARSTENPA